MTAPALPTTNLLGWWYAGDGEGVDPTITGSDGNPVTAWADKSSNGRDLAKAGAGTALYDLSDAVFNGRGSVDFDGSSYFFRNTSGVLGNLTVYTIYGVVALTNSSPRAFFGEGRNASGTPFIRSGVGLGGTGGDVSMSHRSDANVNASPFGGGGLANTGAAALITARRVASNDYRVRLNGTQRGTSAVAPGTTTLDRLAVGTLLRASTLDTFLGKIAMVAIYGGDNFGDVEPLLIEHYDIDTGGGGGAGIAKLVGKGLVN